MSTTQKDLRDAVLEAFTLYERTGAVCEFEGNPMIYASLLQDLAGVARESAAVRDIAVSAACLDLMEKIGGSFIKSLARCYRMADDSNKALLRFSLHHWFAKYNEHLEIIARNAAALTGDTA